MLLDLHGLPLGASSAASRDRYDDAVRALFGREDAALDGFLAAARADPDLALAHAGAAVCHFVEERFEAAQAAVERAEATVAGRSSRERSHVAAVAALVRGRAGDAERAMATHLEAWPSDALIVERLYFVLFWQGRAAEMLALASRARGSGDPTGFLLGLESFALAEADRFAEAEEAAEQALAANPQDAWAVHALAHSLYERGAVREGLARLPSAIHRCTRLGWFRLHLVWHLALWHLALGDVERASRMGRASFERAPSTLPGNVQDAISLLWRLELAGRPAGARWAPWAAVARERIGRPSYPFHAAHLALALVGAGDWTAAERQLGGMRERAGRHGTEGVGQTLWLLAEGIHAFGRGDWPVAAERLGAAAPRWHTLGGSRAQRDVFLDTLAVAALRSGDAGRAREALAARLARRPDALWLRALDVSGAAGALES